MATGDPYCVRHGFAPCRCALFETLHPFIAGRDLGDENDSALSVHELPGDLVSIRHARRVPIDVPSLGAWRQQRERLAAQQQTIDSLLAVVNALTTRLAQARETRDAAQAEATGQALHARALALDCDRYVEQLKTTTDALTASEHAHQLSLTRWREEVDELLRRLNRR